MIIYITPDHFARAAANGISSERLIFRVRSSGWDIEKAITTPMRRYKKLSEDWVKIAAEHGIPRKTFTFRVRSQGWSEEQAAYTPLDVARKRDKNGRYTHSW
jgi:hypothetical protein